VVEMAGSKRAADHIRSGERELASLARLLRPPQPPANQVRQFYCTRVLTAWGYCETAVMCPITAPSPAPAILHLAGGDDQERSALLAPVTEP
jgi:hypothetical protein